MSVMNKIKFFLLTGAVGVSLISQAQPGTPPSTNLSADPAVSSGPVTIVKEDWKPSLRRDGAIDRVEHNNYVTPWQPIREADVLWKKRVWREIDTRQKQNFAFRYPGDDETGGGMYIEILMDAIRKGLLTAFNDDRFTQPLSMEDVMSRVVKPNDTLPVELPDGSIEYRVITYGFNPDQITKYRLKEDWIFDKNVGRMVVRIIGIAPYFDRTNEDGSFRGSVPMFWLYYPDLRVYNARFEVYNPENDVYRMNWDDFFEKRAFASYILKSTLDNPLQEDIKNYKRGIDAMYESEKIREKLFNIEHDLWVY